MMERLLKESVETRFHTDQQFGQLRQEIVGRVEKVEGEQALQAS